MFTKIVLIIRIWGELSTIHLAFANLIGGPNGNQEKPQALFSLCLQKTRVETGSVDKKRATPGRSLSW